MSSVNRPGALPRTLLDAEPRAATSPRWPASHDTPQAVPTAWTQAFGRARAQAQSPGAQPESRLGGRTPAARALRPDDALPEPLSPDAPPLPPPNPWQALRDGLPTAEGAPTSRPVPGADPVSETHTRIAEAARQVAEPAACAPDTARLWQVALPGAAPGLAGWQLQITQPQPQAPLMLDLRVPPAQGLQARQQLADLDRRLRESGHDLLRTRLRRADGSQDGAPRVDEVDA